MACVKCKNFGLVGGFCSECGKCYFCKEINLHTKNCVMTPPKEEQKIGYCMNCHHYQSKTIILSGFGFCNLNPEQVEKKDLGWCSFWRIKGYYNA